MVHWTEGRPPEHAHENFPQRDAKGVRAFVAVRLNHQVEAALAAFIDEVKRPRDGVRWVPPANLHVTLKFLGAEVDSHRLERLTSAMHELAARTVPFEVAAQGIGAFPDLGHPRSIWARLHSVELGALAARIETIAAECGFERENRRFSGHLTIGRVRDPRGFSRTRRALAAAAHREFGISRIESIMLYRSHLEPEGSRYEALATFLFRKPAPSQTAQP